MTEQKKEYQHTIAKEVSYSGIGLHSGKDVLMTLKPAEADTGIVFVRTDLPGRPEIKALPENVSSTVKATTLSANGAEVFTVEHLMGALSMMAIDNIRIEMSSPEPPVTDGSAKVFCELIEKAEPVQQEAEHRRRRKRSASFSFRQKLTPSVRASSRVISGGMPPGVIKTMRFG